ITDLNGFAFCSGDIPSFDVIMAQPWFPNIHQLGQKSVFIPTHGYQDANGNLITEDETITIIRPILSQTEVIG
ncbi:MAG: hypothetical protein RSF73_07890, partial [Ruthenibacterium sp.]